MESELMNERMYYSHDAQMRAQRERMLLVALSVLLGLTFGAVAALLLADRPGREVRAALGGGLEDALDDAQKGVRELRREIDQRVLHH
jgi:gas vesicle protein